MVSLHSTIQDLDPHEWNRLAGDNAFASHGWLLTAENCWLARAAPVYFSLAKEGVLVGSAVCYESESTPGVETLDDMLLGRLRPKANRAGVSFLPALVCGPASGYGWHIGVAAGAPAAEQDAIRHRMVDAMEAEADRRGLRLSFVQVLETEHSLRALLEQRRYMERRNVPVAVMDSPWASMDEYFDQLPPKRRREYRRERRRTAERGVVVEDQTGPWADARIRQLLDANARRHGSDGLAFRQDLLAELHANLGGDALRLVARKGDAMCGAHLALRQGEAIAAFAVGVDPELSGDDLTYFELGYYSLIDYAIRHGIRRIDFGRGMLAVKRRRGCRLTASSVYTRVAGPRRLLYDGWYKVASAWNARMPTE